MKTILFLTGPSCSGKSTIMNDLMTQVPNNYLVSYDKLKWQLTGYDREEHRQAMRKLTLGYLDVVCREGFFVFVELWVLSEDDVVKLQSIADKNFYKVVTAHITAPINILMERCSERISKAKKEGENSSILDEEIYRKSYEIEKYYPESELIIDTSITSLEEATKLILEQLK